GLSMRYHDSRHLGDLLSRISADVNNTLLMLNDAMRELIREPLLAVVSLALAAMAAPKATLMVLVGLPTVVVPVVLLGKRVRKGSTKSLTKLGASVQVLTQMFQGIRTVKAFRAEERELERYREINEEYVHSTMRMVRAIALTGSWTILFTYAGMAAMLVGVGWLSLRTGTFANAGAMAAFFILISNAYNNLKKTTRMWTRVQESVGASERLEAILREPADIV
ncbi:MAG: hypothetical protein KDC18_20400, partial [Alphaproteobacteria bacterium]|nr:hypothetical protein [Alphaproteobacteria bacterium]